MGGYGSGRGGWKRKAEEIKRIEMAYLKKLGYLTPGQRRRFGWTCGGEDFGYIYIESVVNAIILVYKTKDHWHTEWTPVRETVSIEYTPCNFGGTRPWFKCPDCNRRASVLYSTFPYFLCRHCAKVAYSSQSETEADRMMRKARKIREQLGYSGDLTESMWRKPKGMHWKKFYRLREEANNLADKGLILAARHWGIVF